MNHHKWMPIRFNRENEGLYKCENCAIGPYTSNQIRNGKHGKCKIHKIKIPKINFDIYHPIDEIDNQLAIGLET